MNKQNFFQEIQHTPIQWNQRNCFLPCFYQDFQYMFISILAPSKKIKTVLPSERMKPYRITPWHSAISIILLEYRECDIGPYNEIGIGIPFTLDRETPMFTGTLYGMPDFPNLYIHHLPVTTEIALVLGIELLGLPKFLAQIDFTDQGDWMSCKMHAESKHIFTLNGRKLPTREAPRSRFHLFSLRNGFLLRCEFIVSERETGISKNTNDVQLELGDHEIANELRMLDLGKVLNYEYCQSAQVVLTPVLESFAA